MLTISLIGQKGGTGKTTLATGLAIAAVQACADVVIIDLDPQTNALNWGERRNQENPLVVAPPVSRLKQQVELARAGGADVVIIDTPGRSESAALEAARVSDIVLIPAYPMIFELETLKAVRSLLTLANDPKAYVVLNGMHPFASKMVLECRDLVEGQYGISVCPIHICDRDIYRHAPTQGQAPQDLEPDSRAAGELKELYMFAAQHANTKGTAAHEQNGNAKKRS